MSVWRSSVKEEVLQFMREVSQLIEAAFTQIDDVAFVFVTTVSSSADISNSNVIKRYIKHAYVPVFSFDN